MYLFDREGGLIWVSGGPLTRYRGNGGQSDSDGICHRYQQLENPSSDAWGTDRFVPLSFCINWFFASGFIKFRTLYNRGILYGVLIE